MAITLTTEQKQIMSQKMIQSTSILQMNTAELEKYLNEQALENPVIDLAEKQPAQGADQTQDKLLDKYRWLSSHDEQNRYLYRKIEGPDQEMPEWNFKTDAPETLHEHLWGQLLTAGIPASEEPLYHILLDSLDERGWFADTVEGFAARNRLTPEKVQQMLSRLHTLTPAGVGAAGLEECLCIQLRQSGQLTDGLECFITRYLQEMAKNHLPLIAREMKIPLEQVKEYCAVVRGLDPCPGRAFSAGEPISYIAPDVVVEKTDRGLRIRLNDSLCPEITLNVGYLRMYREQDNAEVKSWLSERIRRAEWLRQCVSRRNATLLRVAEAIADCQSAFFEQGPEALGPLRLTDVAERIGMHESTVSRTVRDKYLLCAWGIFPLTHFFRKTAQSRHTAHSTQSAPLANATALDVKTVLKEIIAGEDKQKPYSDQALSELLSARGYPISRRTVAKYRDQEGIPGMSGRKEY